MWMCSTEHDHRAEGIREAYEGASYPDGPWSPSIQRQVALFGNQKRGVVGLRCRTSFHLEDYEGINSQQAYRSNRWH